jgi:hypothetical protein
MLESDAGLEMVVTKVEAGFDFRRRLQAVVPILIVDAVAAPQILRINFIENNVRASVLRHFESPRRPACAGVPLPIYFDKRSIDLGSHSPRPGA